MNPISKLTNNRAVALLLIVIITLTLIRFHQITGYVSSTIATQSFISTYISVLFIIIILFVIYLVYKK